MIDLILLFFVLSKWIYPLAKAKGQSPINWMLFTSALWMFVEFTVLAISVSPVLFFVLSSNKPIDMFFDLLGYQFKLANFQGVCFIYLMACIGGFLSSLIVRRNLSKQKVVQFREPPLPEVFV